MKETDVRSKNLILVAMIFAVSMTFIDQTIVAIAVPALQDDLGLSATGVQWIINGYLLSLSALFALGGRLADVLGHRRMVLVGVVIFASASALCGATPSGSEAEAWIVFWRIVQGAGAALMFPAALAIVISSFPIGERGKAMAIFFAVTGGLTAIGPLAGGYLTELDWRAIFWVNIPVAIIAVVMTLISKPSNEKRPAKLDYRGALLISGGMGLAVLGLQQSSVWGWGDPATWGSIAVGIVLLIAFVAYEQRVENPLIRLEIFRDRGFAADNAINFLLMVCFLPLFFFASMYAQVALGESASEAGLFLLIFFGGFAVASQWGGRILDSRGARPTVIAGCAIAAVGFALWAREMPELSLGAMWPFMVLTGIGIGLVLGPINTDALNRAPASRYGEATGITQTVRNFGASVGMAVLGTILIVQNRSNLETTLGEKGVPKESSDKIADAISGSSVGGGEAAFSEAAGPRAKEIFEAVQLDFALSNRTVFYVMAGVMAVACLLSIATLPKGKVEQVVPADDPAEPVATPQA